jgi:hypothetical protein
MKQQRLTMAARRSANAQTRQPTGDAHLKQLEFLSFGAYENALRR